MAEKRPLLICRALTSRCTQWPECPCARGGKDPEQDEPWNPRHDDGREGE
jgi:hypothetical protein